MTPHNDPGLDWPSLLKGGTSHHLVQLSKIMTSSIAPSIDSVWKFLPRWAMSSLMLEFAKNLFHPDHPNELIDQENWVMEYNTRRAMKHSPILHGTMSPTHGRKSGMGDREVFLLSTIPLSFLIHSQCVFYRFLYPHLHKSWDEISFKRGGL
jgi:hypothetical protein